MFKEPMARISVLPVIIFALPLESVAASETGRIPPVLTQIHAPKPARPTRCSERTPPHSAGPCAFPYETASNVHLFVLRPVNARNASVRSTRSASSSVVTSNPRRRSVDDMSAASLYGFGQPANVGIRAVAHHQRHAAVDQHHRRQRKHDGRQDRHDERPYSSHSVHLFHTHPTPASVRSPAWCVRPLTSSERVGDESQRPSGRRGDLPLNQAPAGWCVRGGLPQLVRTQDACGLTDGS